VAIITGVVSVNLHQGEVYSIQHYVIKFVCDLRQVGGFLFFTNKTDHHDISEILLRLALNTITKQTKKHKTRGSPEPISLA
jgi:hypothetical protein